MRRDRRVFQSKKLAGKRPMALEPLEAKLNLSGFGFQDLIGGFVFTIEGSDFADDGQIFTNPASLNTGFIMQWNDASGTCHTLQGSYSAGDVANEASDRGFGVGDFKGNNVKLLGGHDRFAGDGTNDVTPCSASSPVTNGPLVGNGVLTIAGNGGHDTINGSPGPDDVSGGADNDVITTGDGEDTIDGSVGNDVINSGNDEDLVLGGDGNDVINTGGGDDNASGGPGHDTISGGSGNDTLNGDDGNDDIRGDAGSDVLNGGAGNDALLVDPDDKNPSGGDGTDALQRGPDGPANKGILSDREMLNLDIEKVDTTGADPGDPNDGFKGSAGFSGSPFGPFSAPDNINSNDWDGPTSGVTIITGGGNDTLRGGKGRDLLQGGDDDDQLFGKDAKDTLQGGNGDDILQGDASDDVIDGGAGFDKSAYRESPEAVQVSTTCQLDTQLQALGDTMDPIAGPDCGRMGHAQDDAFTSIEGIIGSDFNDTLFAANTGTDMGGGMVDGGDGDDIIWGGSDDDMLAGGGGNDLIKGFDGNDELAGGKGNDTLRGGNGNDILEGGGDDDDLDGEADTDAYSGGSGDDVLRTAYTGGTLEDLLTDNGFQGFLFGDIGQDNFLVDGADTAAERLDVRSELATAETLGLSDFQANDDDLNFD